MFHHDMPCRSILNYKLNIINYPYDFDNPLSQYIKHKKIHLSSHGGHRLKSNKHIAIMTASVRLHTSLPLMGGR